MIWVTRLSAAVVTVQASLATYTPWHRTQNLNAQKAPPAGQVQASMAPRLFKLIPWLVAAFSAVAAYEVPVSDTDYSSQVCSGMWGGSSAYINGKWFLYELFDGH